MSIVTTFYQCVYTRTIGLVCHTQQQQSQPQASIFMSPDITSPSMAQSCITQCILLVQFILRMYYGFLKIYIYI